MTSNDNNALIEDIVTEPSQPPYERFDVSEAGISENPNESSTSKADSRPDTVPWKKFIVTNIFISLLIAGIVSMPTGLISKSVLDEDIEDLRTSMEKEFRNAYIKLNTIDILEEQINNMSVDELRTRLPAQENMVPKLLLNISKTEDALNDKIYEVARNSRDGLALLLDKTQCLACKVGIPKMSMENYTFSVQENSVNATYVGTVVAAAGICMGDSQAFSYNISEGPFVINSTTGVISTASRLDREANPVITFDVSVTYTCSSIQKTSSTSTVYVHLVDVNDNQPTFTQRENFLGALLSTVVGATIGTLNAVDPDEGQNGKVYYSVTPNNTFNITETTGQVYLVKPLNETIPFYQLNVTARDGGSPSLSTSVMVNVDVDLRQPA